MSVLGKIFISHSSIDKKFVRKLSKKLQTEGYETWIDEKELKPGDALSREVFKAISECKVFFVIVSSAAIKSSWLKSELNSITERMIKGECRVIPIVIEKVELPPEVRGLLYSDFTSSFKIGYQGISTALKYEYQKMIEKAGFWRRVREIAEEVFGNLSFLSAEFSYKRFEYSIFDLPYLKNDGTDLGVVYESIQDYSKKGEPLDNMWRFEFNQENSNNIFEYLFLVITERPIHFMTERTSSKSDRVKLHGNHGVKLVAFVDLSGLDPHNWRYHIEVAREELISYALANLEITPI